MKQSLQTVEPTIWALRKHGVKNHAEHEPAPTLHEHLFGYDPIKLQHKPGTPETVRRGSAENPALNIINPKTNFTLIEIASDLPPEDA